MVEVVRRGVYFCVSVGNKGLGDLGGGGEFVDITSDVGEILCKFFLSFCEGGGVNGFISIIVFVMGI